MTKIICQGLEGSNPLAFMAAIGAFRTIALSPPYKPTKIHWTNENGVWNPILSTSDNLSCKSLVALLTEQLNNKANQTVFSISDNLTIPCDQYSKLAFKEAEKCSPNDRRYVDFLAAFGSEAIESSNSGKSERLISDTAFRTMGGAGHQHFVGSMRTLAADTTDEHIFKALFSIWKYDDPAENHTMRWDPQDDVRYALRWRNSSGDPTRKKSGSMWGANRLAIEALPLMPTMPTNGRLETSGFTYRENKFIWTWPIWTQPIDLDVLRSILSIKELQSKAPNRKFLASIGIDEIFQCNRITTGKFRNFTPSWPA